MVYVIQVCWQLASRIRTELSWFCRTKPVPSWSCSQAVSKHVWRIPLLCVQWKTPDDGQSNCPKHVEFYSKNKFEKSLVRLVRFIIRIYHDARSPERLIPQPEANKSNKTSEFFKQLVFVHLHLSLISTVVLFITRSWYFFVLYTSKWTAAAKYSIYYWQCYFVVVAYNLFLLHSIYRFNPQN